MKLVILSFLLTLMLYEIFDYYRKRNVVQAQIKETKTQLFRLFSDFIITSSRDRLGIDLNVLPEERKIFYSTKVQIVLQRILEAKSGETVATMELNGEIDDPENIKRFVNLVYLVTFLLDAFARRRKMAETDETQKEFDKYLREVKEPLQHYFEDWVAQAKSECHLIRSLKSGATTTVTWIKL